MTSKEAADITDFKKCDFTKMNEYFKEKSEAKKQLTKEEKQVCSANHYVLYMQTRS